MAVTQLELIAMADERQNEKIKTWHNGRYGVWRWSDLTKQEQRNHEQAQRRAEYVAVNNPNGLA
jgi:hypothetical protein